MRQEPKSLPLPGNQNLEQTTATTAGTRSHEGGLCAGAALLLGASFLRKPLGCAIAPPTTTPRGQASRVITSPALALERCGRMSQHLPAATETKSLVSPPATSLRQEAELGDGMTAEEHRPALQRQAEEHHRPEQASDRGSASSGPQDAPVTAQLCVLHAGLIDKIDLYSHYRINRVCLDMTRIDTSFHLLRIIGMKSDAVSWTIGNSAKKWRSRSKKNCQTLKERNRQDLLSLSMSDQGGRIFGPRSKTSVLSSETSGP